ncbi:hypothetical protein [Lyngbya aestuarii]|uniref:hypothetical protein n=1 Tax=Lyngbya aestuarii TaxID=118322 RepID=UPI00403DB51D
MTLQSRLARGLQLEIKYFQRKFRIFKLSLLIISFMQFVVISFGDVQSFFLSKNSLIPNDWHFFKNPTTVKLISIIFVVAVYLFTWLLDSIEQSQEIGELESAVKTYVLPWTENKLKSLINRNLRQKYSLSDNIRASIFLPVRIGFFQWRLQMVCRTENIKEKELDALFAFNEGVLGYTFARVKKYHVEFVDVSTPQNIPSTYVPLSQDNRNLIEQEIKAVTVLAFSQGNSIIGLLAIDTTDDLDFQALQNRGLHSEALNWMRYRKQEIELLWRMMNNV